MIVLFDYDILSAELSVAGFPELCQVEGGDGHRVKWNIHDVGQQEEYRCVLPSKLRDISFNPARVGYFERLCKEP